MNKKTFYPLLSALACAGAMMFAPAQAKPAPVSCDDSTMAATSCSGPFKHSVDIFDEVASFGEEFALASTSNADVSFIGAPSGERAGMLTFDAPLVGPFVVGIRAGNMYSFYLFEDSEKAVEGVAFDTLGVAERGNEQAAVMTQALLFTPGGVLPQVRVPADDGDGEPAVTAPPTAQQVPEPASGALAVLALAAAGLATRRRRSR